MNCLKLWVSGGKQLKVSPVSPAPSASWWAGPVTGVLVVQLKAVAIDGALGPVHQDSVQFDSELPEFR